MRSLDWDTLHECLGGMRYPCDRADLVQHAASHGADDDLLGHLSGLPDRRFDGQRAVDEALSARWY